MIFFGHIGITTGVFKVCENTGKRNKDIHRGYDFRYVILGSILPDIIDKPIGAWLLRSTFHNSRIIGHTLLFSILLIMCGLYRRFKKGRKDMLLVGAGCIVHLILDSMWLYRGTLLWPLYGLKFPERAEGNWLNMSLERLIQDPFYYLSEAGGFVYMLFLFLRGYNKDKLRGFIDKGRL